MRERTACLTQQTQNSPQLKAWEKKKAELRAIPPEQNFARTPALDGVFYDDSVIKDPAIIAKKKALIESLNWVDQIRGDGNIKMFSDDLEERNWDVISQQFFQGLGLERGEFDQIKTLHAMKKIIEDKMPHLPELIEVSNRSYSYVENNGWHDASLKVAIKIKPQFEQGLVFLIHLTPALNQTTHTIDFLNVIS